MNDELMKFVPQVHFELIPIKNLVSNQDYQRNVSMKHVQKTAANFDVNQINPVKVSRRNGENYVFNGQHTIETLFLVSGSADVPVWCMVYDNLEYIEEADIFANQLKFTRPLSPYEIFVANIEAGNTKQLTIRDLVNSYNLNIEGKPGPGSICAVYTLEKIFDHYGYQILDRTISLITATWEGEAKSYSSSMLMGVARLIYAYGNSLKDELFKEKLSQTSIREISRTAKDRRAGSLGYSETILNLYNSRRAIHNCLPLEKLYHHKNIPIISLSPDEDANEENYVELDHIDTDDNVTDNAIESNDMDNIDGQLVIEF